MSTSHRNISMYQWQTANALVTPLQAEVARAALWIKSPRKANKPDLFGLIADWTQVYDLTERLKAASFTAPIPTAQEERYRQNRVYTLQYMQDLVPQVNGMMKAMELYRQKEYIGLLVKDIGNTIKQFLLSLKKYNSQDLEDQESIYTLRDRMEWFRMGLFVIREDFPRLDPVDYDSYLEQLQKADSQFRLVTNGQTEPLPYFPLTFAWRREKW